MKSEALAERCKQLKLILTDVDGVLTDGTVLLMPDGREAKSFHIRDGLGIVLAQRVGLRTSILSGRRSEAVVRRAAIAAGTATGPTRSARHRSSRPGCSRPRKAAR